MKEKTCETCKYIRETSVCNDPDCCGVENHCGHELKNCDDVYSGTKACKYYEESQGCEE